jgi:hypothetical protein
MHRDKLEKLTASLVVTLITVLSFGFIMIVANWIFEWDLFPPFTEKILYFSAWTMLVIIAASAIVNIMLNLSRLAFYTERIASNLSGTTDLPGRKALRKKIYA